MFGIYDSNGDLYAYADTRRDADKALKEVPGGRAVDLSRPGMEGPFRTSQQSMVYYDPREGRYYDPDSDLFLDRDVDPFRRNPRYTVDTTQRGVVEVDGRLRFLDEVLEDQMALSVMAAVGDASAKKTLRTLLSAKKAQKRAESIAWMQDAYNVSPQQVVAGSGNKSFAGQVLDGWAAFGREPSGASQEVRRAAVTAVKMADASPMLSVSGGAEQKRSALSAAATIAQAMGLLSDRDHDVLRSHAGRLIRNPADDEEALEGGNDYFVGVYRSAVMGGEHEPKEASQEYRRGYREGAAIARKHPDAVAYAQGYHEAAHDLPRAGQMLINHVRELEERSGSKRRNPGMSQKTAKQFLATMPTGITLDVNGKRVRRVGDDHYAIDGVRYTSAQACKRIA